MTDVSRRRSREFGHFVAMLKLATVDFDKSLYVAGKALEAAGLVVVTVALFAGLGLVDGHASMGKEMSLLTIVRGTRAAHVLGGVVALAVLYRAATQIGLVGLQSFIGYIAPFTAIGLVVLFKSEIRRSLTQLGSQDIFGAPRHEEALEDIVLALKVL